MRRVSNTREPGEFKVKRFYASLSKKYRYQWDYRDQAGIPHMGVAKSVEHAERAASKYGYRGALIV